MPSPAPVLRETLLSPRLLLLTLGGDTMLTSWGTNCLALAGRDGTLVVDPLIAPAQARVVEVALAPLFADAAPYAPTETFDSSRTIDLGDVGAEVRHLGPGHTPGDAVVIFPSERVAATGDLVFHGFHFNYEEADVGALPARLDALRALPVERFVPGHGEPGGREILDEQARYHAEVARLVRAAASPEEARAAVLARFPGFALEMAVESAVLAHRAGRR